MTMKTGNVRSPWYGVLISVASILIVSAVAVAQEWNFISWLLAAGLCTITGAAFTVSQVRRNRRLDEVVDRVKATAPDKV